MAPALIHKALIAINSGFVDAIGRHAGTRAAVGAVVQRDALYLIEFAKPGRSAGSPSEGCGCRSPGECATRHRGSHNRLPSERGNARSWNPANPVPANAVAAHPRAPCLQTYNERLVPIGAATGSAQARVCGLPAACNHSTTP